MARRRANTKATALVAYLRCSSDEQADSGLGLDAQRRAVTQYAELYGLTLADVIVDPGYSAKDLERPGMRRVLKLLESGKVAGVIVAKLDRLTRSVRDVGTLVERHFGEGRARLVSVGEQIDTTTAAGRLVLNVLASVGQWEREAIGERTKAALAVKRRRGERISRHLPYGMELDPTDSTRLQECAREQAVIRAARAMRAEGKTTTAIADELTERYPNACRGERFYQPFVWKLVQ